MSWLSWLMRSASPEAREPKDVESGITITDLSQLPSVWTLEQPLNWLIDGFKAAKSVTLLTAESGTGKTWVSYALAGAPANGKRFLDLQVQQRPVLYLDGENPLAVVKRNLAELGIEETAALTVWGGWNEQPPQGPDNKLLVEFAKAKQGVIIYDSLVEFHPGDEQSSTETRKFMRKFRRLADYGATVIVLHHTGKAQGAQQYRGSSDIKAAVDTAYLLKKISDSDGKLHRLNLDCYKYRLAPGRNFGLEFRAGQGFMSCEVPRQENRAEPEEILFEIIAENPEITGTEIGQLARERGLSKGEVEELLPREANKPGGRWQRRQGKGNTYRYTVKGHDAEAA